MRRGRSRRRRSRSRRNRIRRRRRQHRNRPRLPPREGSGRSATTVGRRDGRGTTTETTTTRRHECNVAAVSYTSEGRSRIGPATTSGERGGSGPRRPRGGSTRMPRGGTAPDPYDAAYYLRSTNNMCTLRPQLRQKRGNVFAFLPGGTSESRRDVQTAINNQSPKIERIFRSSLLAPLSHCYVPR